MQISRQFSCGQMPYQRLNKKMTYQRINARDQFHLSCRQVLEKWTAASSRCNMNLKWRKVEFLQKSFIQQYTPMTQGLMNTATHFKYPS
jgi:hypothetical protein